jgi:hypothetical protein
MMQYSGILNEIKQKQLNPLEIGEKIQSGELAEVIRKEEKSIVKESKEKRVKENNTLTELLVSNFQL